MHPVGLCVMTALVHMQMLMFTAPGPRVQTTQQYLTTCRIEGTGSGDGTTVAQVRH